MPKEYYNDICLIFRYYNTKQTISIDKYFESTSYCFLIYNMYVYFWHLLCKNCIKFNI